MRSLPPHACSLSSMALITFSGVLIGPTNLRKTCLSSSHFGQSKKVCLTSSTSLQYTQYSTVALLCLYKYSLKHRWLHGPIKTG